MEQLKGLKKILKNLKIKINSYFCKELIEMYKQTFKPIINQIRSELVVLCPKPEEYINSRLNK